MKTEKFTATLGIASGYGHENQGISDPLMIAGSAWQSAAKMVFEENGIYVGSVIKPAHTVYNTDWGCPQGGEITVEISGERNPEYTPEEGWKDTVIKILRLTAKELGQSTTQLTFSEVDFVYLDFREKE